jgi:ergothioneine biosynthesis protein EgtB
MPDASPSKWHLAHTSWFFETVVLQEFLAGYQPFNACYHYLFNSYYEALGPRHARPRRGMLTRPGLAEVLQYRAHVDAAMQRLIGIADDADLAAASLLMTLGLHHEQQHQELIWTDILHAFACNPLLPAAVPGLPEPAPGNGSVRWLEHPGGIVQVGCDAGAQAFAFDNEGPRHAALLRPFAMASTLVRCGDFAEFIADGGYRTASLWLSDGWALVQAQGLQAPANWLAPGDSRAPSDQWQVFGLAGVQPLKPEAAVSQLSFYEAAAYAAWAGGRLPTEFEWEAASGLPGMEQLYDTAWQWTRSSYDPYPGFAPLPGAVAEYNGKFMVGQMVLRGGSLATPDGHSRASYRNFFPPAARWQFSGIRLARDAGSGPVALC